MRRLTFTLVLLVSLLALTPSRVFACSCLTPPFSQAFTSATAVFTGKVIDIETPTLYSAEPVKVTFQILKAWKGPNEENLVVTTASQSISCGISFGELETDTYLVYAYGADKQLSTHVCSRTAPLSVAGADILKLNVITHPMLVVMLSVAIGLAISGIIFYILRRKRPA